MKHVSKLPPTRRAGPPARAEVAPAATVAFRGTDARIRLPPGASVAAIRLDGAALPQDAWRVTAESTIRLACPPGAFDAEPHVLALALQDGGEVELPFRSVYLHALDEVGDDRIAGWIYDSLRPSSSLTLEVQSGDGPAFGVLNTLEHKALKGRDPPVSGGGFELLLPPRASLGRAEIVSVTVRGTDHMPFGPILRGVTLPAAVAAATSAGRALGRSAQGLLLGTTLLPRMVEALSSAPQALPGASSLWGFAGLPRPAAPRIDVIVPVYRGRDETLECLRSVLRSGDRIAHRVVVIDDCSPELDLSADLAVLAAESGIEYLRNERNLGFVATANRGMALSRDADVLLLNADTVVPPGFLDRLYRAAYADAAIATVTPLSNNATICSLPCMPGTDDAPYGLPMLEIDSIVRTVNADEVRDIPTAHGFCMFIKRAALDEIGPFDADTFGAGYGEENDFALRAFERGWRNVCAADVYVQHAGAVSFAGASLARVAENLGKVEARYPYYHDLVADFLRSDPLHDLRNRVQKQVWRQVGRIVLFVTLSLEGGAVRHVDDMMARLTAEGCLVLALATERDRDGRAVLVVRRWDSQESLRYPQPAPVAEALADILDLPPQFIHVQHLLDLPNGVGEFVRDCGIPYAVTLHDFFYGCPRVTLLDDGDGYCGIPSADKCTACVRHGPIHAGIHPSLRAEARIGEVWRGKWGALLREALQVIAPSNDTAERYARLFPGLPVEVKPHFSGSQPAVPAPPITSPASRLRVAIPGAIGPQKGARQLVDLARHCSRWDTDLTLVVVGRTDRDVELEDYDNLVLAGSYAQGTAVAALRAADCRVALFLSIFPETYSYTLSESLEAGLVPVAYDFGAIGERLRSLGVGVLVPLRAPPAELVAAIRRASEMTVAVPREAIYASYGTLLADYYAPALTDLADSMPPPDQPRLLTWPSGVQNDRWCGGEIALQFWSARPFLRVALSFWVPPSGRFQAVEIVWNGRTLAREFLAENEVRRIVCTIPARDVRYLDLTCRFDFLFALAPPDIRRCAAMFAGAEFSEGGGWQKLELPQIGGTA